MLQGGDFTKGDGTGGLSIYGEKVSSSDFLRSCRTLIHPSSKVRNLNQREPALIPLPLPDEAFPHKHDRPMLFVYGQCWTEYQRFSVFHHHVSRIFRSPGALLRPFVIVSIPLISTASTLFFGRVLLGKSLVRRIENLPTTSDKPNVLVTIASAGVLTEEQVQEERNKATQSASSDPYADYPVDEESTDVDKPENCVPIASKLKGHWYGVSQSVE